MHQQRQNYWRQYQLKTEYFVLKQKYDHYHSRDYGRFLTLNMPNFFAQINNNWNVANNINYSKQNHECREYFFKIKLHEVVPLNFAAKIGN